MDLNFLQFSKSLIFSTAVYRLIKNVTIKTLLHLINKKIKNIDIILLIVYGYLDRANL